MKKAKQVIHIAETKGIAAAELVAKEFNLNLFTVDVGPGSRIEVWDAKWRSCRASGRHIRMYGE